MNVSYECMNAEDAARILKRDKSTITAWCRKGIISYQDVSEPGSKKPRYLIPDWEINRVKKLIAKYGTKKWLFYNEQSKEETEAKYRADEEEGIKNGTICPCEFEVNQVPLDLSTPVKVKEEDTENLPTRRKRIDPDDILKTIMYIQDINDRLEDLEAEKNQLINEREACKKEVMEAMEIGKEE